MDTFIELHGIRYEKIKRTKTISYGGKLSNYEYEVLIVCGFADNQQSLKCICLPETVQGFPIVGIAPRAFKGTDISFISFFGEVSEIGKEAFMNCTNLLAVHQNLRRDEHFMSLKMHKMSIETYRVYDITIGKSAFHGCTNLINVSFLRHLNSIDENAFAGCVNLCCLDASLGTIHETSFDGCVKLEKLCFERNANLPNGCFNNTGVQTLKFETEPDSVSEQVRSMVIDNGIVTKCHGTSSFVNKIFDGGIIELID